MFTVVVVVLEAFDNLPLFDRVDLGETRMALSVETECRDKGQTSPIIMANDKTPAPKASACLAFAQRHAWRISWTKAGNPGAASAA